MLNRREDGKLTLKSLDLQIFLGDLFEKCKTEREVEWLQGEVTACVEIVADDKREEL